MYEGGETDVGVISCGQGVGEEVNKEYPDLNNVANLARERLQKMPGIIGKTLDLFMDFYNQVLTDEQRAKVIEMLRERCG